MRGLSIALTWLLVASALSALALAGAYASDRSLLARARDGQFVSYAEGHASDGRIGAAVGFAFCIGLAVLVVLIVFLYRASKNTELWQQQSRRWAAGWTIGGWFIPVANIVIPFLVVAEIWKRSPEPGPGGVTRRVGASPVGIWWGAWIVGNLGFGLGRNHGPEPVNTLMQHDAFRIVASLALFLASIVLILVVRQLNARQMRLAAMAPTTSPPPAPPSYGDFTRV